MKCIIVSDLHFGDKECCLHQSASMSAFFQTLKDSGALDPEPDFLVLLGDVFDFSVSTYANTFDKAQPFFLELRDKVKDIIYVPGNHDGDFWHLIDNQINVLKPIENGKNPNSLMMTCPAVLTETSSGFDLCWSKPKAMSYAKESNRADRVGLFVDSLVSGEEISTTLARVRAGEPWPPRIWVAYPNLYLVNEQETILLTHGHYFEPWWALGGEVVSRLCPSCFQGIDVQHPLVTYPQDGDHYTSLYDTVGLNYPLSQLICSGVGQAGNLCQYAKAVQAEVKAKDLTVIDRIVRNLPSAASRSFVSPRAGIRDRIKARGVNLLAGLGAGLVHFAVNQQTGKVEPARGKADMFDTPEAEDRLNRYLFATNLEVDELNQFADKEALQHPARPFPYIRYPEKMIFGHTHQPITDFTTDDYTGMKYLNCGGFVNDGRAAGFIYDQGKIVKIDF